MTIARLAKLYQHLTAWERLPLIIAAAARNDQLERRRLVDSAPTVEYKAPDYSDLGQALDKVADCHLLTLLDVAAKYWQWWGIWGWRESAGRGRAGQARRPSKKSAPRKKPAPKAEAQRAFRTYCLVRYHAYLFATHVAAWKLFCADLVIDPEVLFRGMPCWDTITRTEAQARTHAFSHKDAAMFLLSERRDEDDSGPVELPQVVTVEGLVKAWHEVIAAHLQ